MMRRRSGYTLIEFLAATLLAAMVLASSIGVIRTILRSTRDSIGSTYQTRHHAAEIAERLEEDLANSISLQGGNGRLVLATSMTNHDARPLLVRITYVAEEAGGRRCLFRESSEEGAGRSLVCVGIEHLEIALADIDGWSKPIVVASDNATSVAGPLTYRTIHGDAVRLTIGVEESLETFVVYPKGVP